jgi:FemAB-related protein (PEP-CTERM system-associated)
MKYSLCSDADRPAWDRYVRGHRGATACHLFAWRDVVRDVFRQQPYFLAARDDSGDVRGVLPLVRLKSLLFGDFLVSMPYVNYGGALADSAAIEQGLIGEAVSQARKLGVSHIELRHVDAALPTWPTRTDKVSMRLPLQRPAEEFYRSLHSKLRSQIKRPEKGGATCQSGGAEHLDAFYGVFAENMRDLGTPVYSKRFFAAVLAAFPEQARLFVVRVADEPAAAGLVLGFGKVLEIPWASSLRRFNRLSVNMLLYWKVIEYACNQGFETFDFGRSSADSGTFKFKQQWGAQPVQLHWHYWLRNGGDMPQLNPGNPKYRIAISAWQRLPVAIANALGPLVVRNLP